MGGPGSGRKKGSGIKNRFVPWKLLKKDVKKLSKRGMYAH